MAERVSRDRLLGLSIGVSLLVGVPVGTLAFGLFTRQPSLITSSDVAGVPVLVYAFISGGPFAVLAGVAGSAVLRALVHSRGCRSRWYLWVAACAGCGLACGVVVAVAMMLIAAQEQVGWALLASAGVAGLAGGTVLGVAGWRRAHGRLPE